MSKLRLGIIEDDLIVSDSLVSFFKLKSDIELVFVSSSMESFFEQVQNAVHEDKPFPEILLLDIQLPGKSGIEGIPEIKKIMPDVNIIMLTTFEESEKIFMALSAGACSYLTKQSTLSSIYECIITVSNGGSYMSPAIARKVIAFFNSKSDTTNPLSQRQKEIVSCIVDGLSYKMVASKLDISLDTVRTHIMQIYRSLNINSKGELIKWAISRK